MDPFPDWLSQLFCQCGQLLVPRKQSNIDDTAETEKSKGEGNRNKQRKRKRRWIVWNCSSCGRDVNIAKRERSRAAAKIEKPVEQEQKKAIATSTAVKKGDSKDKKDQLKALLGKKTKSALNLHNFLK